MKARFEQALHVVTAIVAIAAISLLDSFTSGILIAAISIGHAICAFLK